MSITLRSRRGPIGTSWAAGMLRSSLGDELRPRTANAGKRIARAGLVDWFDISPGLARAEVQDETTGQAVIARLEFSPLPAGDRAVLLDLAHAHPELPAQLVAGEYPPDFEVELSRHEISLLPHGASEYSHDCSCQDWPGPCAHVAALGYVLVEAVDVRPIHLLTLRGLSLEDIAPPAVSARQAASESAPAPAVDPGDGQEYLEGDDSDDPAAPRFDPTRGDATLLVEALGPDVARVLARFYGAAEPSTAQRGEAPPTDG